MCERRRAQTHTFTAEVFEYNIRSEEKKRKYRKREENERNLSDIKKNRNNFKLFISICDRLLLKKIQLFHPPKEKYPENIAVFTQWVFACVISYIYISINLRTTPSEKGHKLKSNYRTNCL